MQLQPLDDLVDLLALGMEPKADEIERIRRHRRDGGAVVAIIAGCEQFFGIEMRPDTALLCPLQHVRKLGTARGEDQDRLADQGPVEAAGRILIRFACEFGGGSDEPAGEEACDIEFLPGCEIIANHDGDLGIVTHGCIANRGRQGQS